MYKLFVCFKLVFSKKGEAMKTSTTFNFVMICLAIFVFLIMACSQTNNPLVDAIPTTDVVDTADVVDTSEVTDSPTDVDETVDSL